MLISEVKNQRQSVYEYSNRAVNLYNEHEEDSKDISKNRIIYNSNQSHQSIEMSDRNQTMKARFNSKISQNNLWHEVPNHYSEISKPPMLNSSKSLTMSKFKTKRKDTNEVSIRIGQLPDKGSESEDS